MKKIIFAITTLFAVGTTWADDAAITIGGVEMSNSSNSAGFAAVKKKIGKWQGRMTQSLTGQSFDVSYEWGDHIRGKYDHRANRGRWCRDAHHLQ